MFETHLVYSGYRIVWSKNAFYLDKLKKNEHAFGSTIDSLCNVQIVSKLNESWSMHQADGNTNFVCSSTSGVFEIRYKLIIRKIGIEYAKSAKICQTICSIWK